MGPVPIVLQFRTKMYIFVFNQIFSVVLRQRLCSLQCKKSLLTKQNQVYCKMNPQAVSRNKMQQEYNIVKRMNKYEISEAILASNNSNSLKGESDQKQTHIFGASISFAHEHLWFSTLSLGQRIRSNKFKNLPSSYDGHFLAQSDITWVKYFSKISYNPHRKLMPVQFFTQIVEIFDRFIGVSSGVEHQPGHDVLCRDLPFKKLKHFRRIIFPNYFYKTKIYLPILTSSSMINIQNPIYPLNGIIFTTEKYI